MNKRIEQLAHAALKASMTHNGVYRPEGYANAVSKEFADRFAELIIQECIAQIEPMWARVEEVGPPPGYDRDTFDLAYNDSINAIKERFGVDNAVE